MKDLKHLMQGPHVPTLLCAAVGVVVLLFLYHVIVNRPARVPAAPLRRY